MTATPTPTVDLDLESQARRLVAHFDEPIDHSLVGGSAQAAEFMDIVEGIRAALLGRSA